ncbi:MAG: oligoribonuclease [Burkholderiales bacterium]
MAQDSEALIWIDMEMSGLSPQDDQILEVALVVTDAALNVISEAPVLVLHQDDAVLLAMDDWNKSTHAKSGLLDRVKSSTLAATDAEIRLLSFLQPLIPTKASPMCGNSVCQDRRFLARHMPELEAYFHYRNLDVSTLKELARRWRPDLTGQFVKQRKHEALADIYESIEELKFYRENFLNMVRSER